MELNEQSEVGQRESCGEDRTEQRAIKGSRAKNIGHNIDGNISDLEKSIVAQNRLSFPNISSTIMG